MHVASLLLTALILAPAGTPGANDAARDCIVLLHGLVRSERSMRPLERRLSTAGFRVLNLSYPSTTGEPDHLLGEIKRKIATCRAEPSTKLHFVTHSLGGILLRAYLRNDRPENLGRVVMLAPPNHGSEIVDALGGFWLFRSFFGPTAVQLGTDSESLPKRLGPADFEVGIIAGTRSHNPIGSWLIPGPDDGTVSVRSTKLEGMSDFLEYPRSHFFIMSDPAVAEQVLRFIRFGRFSRPTASGASVGEASRPSIPPGLPWMPTEGRELIGEPAPSWENIEWIQGGPLSLEELRGKVVLLRFWLTGCSYCTRTAPALNDLSRKYRARGLVVVGLHHPKNRYTKREEIVREAVRDLAFRFPVGVDNDWTTLDRYWTGTTHRSFTSVTFLIGRDGRIRFLHDGGEFFHGEGEPGRAYAAVETMVERLLDEDAVE